MSDDQSGPYMMSSLYFLAFAFFLASTTLLFLVWHCRARQQQEQARQLEVQDRGDSELYALAGLTYLARGAPTFVIRALPTHVFSSGGNGGGGGGGAHASKAASSDDLVPDLEMGARSDQQQGQQRQEQGVGQWQQHHHHQQEQQQQQQADDDDGNENDDRDHHQHSQIGQQKRTTQPDQHEIQQEGQLQREQQQDVAAQAHARQQPEQHHHEDQQQQQQQHLGAGCCPAHARDVASAPSTSAQPGSSLAAVVESPDVEECTICLCAYADGDVVKQLTCSHTFHADCIDVWLRKSATCPLCKHVLWDPVPVSVLSLYLEFLALRRQMEDRRLSLRAGAASGAAGAPSPAGAGGTTPARRVPAQVAYEARQLVLDGSPSSVMGGLSHARGEQHEHMELQPQGEGGQHQWHGEGQQQPHVVRPWRL